MCMEHQTFFLNVESTNKWGSDDVRKNQIKNTNLHLRTNLIPQEPILLV